MWNTSRSESPAPGSTGADQNPCNFVKGGLCLFPGNIVIRPSLAEMSMRVFVFYEKLKERELKMKDVLYATGCFEIGDVFFDAEENPHVIMTINTLVWQGQEG